MPAPIVAVVPLGKGGLTEAQATAEALWCAMPREDRVVFDYGNGLPFLRDTDADWNVEREPGGGGGPVDRSAAVVAAAHGGKRRLVRGDAPRPGDAELIRSLSKRGVAVLVLTRWLLTIPKPGVRGWGDAERSLVNFLATSETMVVGCNVSPVSAHYSLGLEVEAVLRSIIGDRLWVLRPRSRSYAYALSGAAAVAGETVYIHDHEAPLPAWVASIVIAHAGLPAWQASRQRSLQREGDVAPQAG